MENHKIFRIISKVADKLDVDTYVIGGFVRDFLLNRTHELMDIDIVAIGSGIKLAQAVAGAVGESENIVSV